MANKTLVLDIKKAILDVASDTVVPKSEVEALQAEIDRLRKHNTEYARKHYEDGYNTAKSEVAREIFEEIYRSVASKIPMQISPIFKDDMDFDAGFINGKRDALLDVLVIIAELKKKYTEGQSMTDEQIIKAMNLCYCQDGDFKECPYKPFIDCVNALGGNALELINRQLACIEHKDAEIKRLQNLLNDFINDD